MANSNEDGNLSKSPRVTKEIPWSDFDLSFFARTSSDGDVFKKTDAASVKQSLKTLLLTNRFEKPYRPAFGGDLSNLLFEMADENTGEEIATRIKSAVQRYEPRVKIINLKVTARPDRYTVNVLIEFRIVNTGIVDVLKLVLGASEDCTPEFNPAPAKLPPPNDRILTEDLRGIITEGGGTLQFDDAVPGIYP
jgi:phage baseplate assembly protein W